MKTEAKGKIRRRRWVHKDGIPVLYDAFHPDGLTYAIFPLPPSCPLALRSHLRVLKVRLAAERRTARVTFHEIKCAETALAALISDLARKAVAAL